MISGRDAFRKHWLTQAGVALLMLVTSACTRDADMPLREERDAERRDPRLIAPDDSIGRLARRVFEAFLEASREGSESATSLDSLTRCDDGNASYFPSTMLADYTVQQLESRGDTVVARASVVTVAEQDIDRRTSGFVARQRIRTDVLEWDVYANEYGSWVVCNGLRFGFNGADSLTTWRPEGTSRQTAKQQADSIRANRRQ